VLADHLGGDPVQPWPGVSAAGVVAAAIAERGKKHVGHNVGRDLLAKPPRDIPVDLVRVPVKDHGEQFRVIL
jgi:hypothetical protein